MGYNYWYKNMKEALILEHKTFISAKRAAEVSGYASDYVGQLCRAGKLECKMVGRSWFVTEESLKKHQLSVLEDSKVEVKEEVAEIAPVSRKEETLVLEVPVVVPVSSPVIAPTVTPVETPVAAPVVSTIPVSVVASTPVVSAPTISRVSFVPHTFALPYSISQAYLFAPTYRREVSESAFPFFKLSLGLSVFVIAFFFMFQSLIFTNSSSKNISLSSSVTASVISASQEFIGKVFSFFSAIPELARTVFRSKTPVAMKVENSPPEFNGIAVVPSSDSQSQDEAMKQKIRDSFSDEVQVKPDKSGTAGVITPVFRKAKGDDFIYVLVPVQNQ